MHSGDRSVQKRSTAHDLYSQDLVTPQHSVTQTGKGCGNVALMRVLIAAPFGISLLQLQEVLSDLDAEILPDSDIGRRPWTSVDDWSAADAAIAVLVGQDEGRIIMEAGIAIGRGIPLLVLADHPVSVPFPPDIKVVEMSGLLLNVDALRFQLSLFLKTLTETTSPSDKSATPTAIDISAFRSRLQEIRSGREAGTGLRLEKWVADLFQAAGASIATPNEREARGFDFVAAVPGADPKISPLLVEVKSARSEGVLDNIAVNLQFLVLQERAGLGVLIYDDALFPDSFTPRTVPMVISIGTDQLLQSLERRSISAVIVAARNEAVHRL